jgi:hypothetical protein
LGKGFVTVATTGGHQDVLMREKLQREEAAAAGSTAAIG